MRVQPRKLQALVGDDTSNIEVPDRAGFVFVRLHGDAEQIVEAFYGSEIVLVYDQAVEVLERRALGRYEILGIGGVAYDSISATGDTIYGLLKKHARQHERRNRGEGGSDPVNVYLRMLVELRARAQTTPNLTVYVEYGWYSLGAHTLWEGGNSPAFTPPTGFNQWRQDLLYLGSDDALHILTGTAVAVPTEAAFPTPPANSIPICFVLLTTGQTTITEASITDARIAWGGVGVSATSHNLLSSIHPDTLAASVVAGDLVYANATPKWARLPKGTNGDLLAVVGGMPAWENSFDRIMTDGDGQVMVDGDGNVMTE